MDYDWKEIVSQLTRLLRLHKTPIGIRAYRSLDEMEQVPKLRRAKHLHVPCQFFGQAIQMGFTVGFTAEDIATSNCSATVGLSEQDEVFRSGKIFAGGWCATEADATAHHSVLTAVNPPYAGIVASPLTAGRIEPDICMLTMYPGQAFMLLSGHLRNGYQPLNLLHIGESSCSMHWVKTLSTGKIGLALPCFAEMRFAGFSEQEVNLTMTPQDLVHALDGLAQLNKCGFRYPVPNYAVQMDALEGLGGSYDVKGKGGAAGGHAKRV